MAEYASEAEGRGLQIVIAGAGGSGHLPGMVASHSTLPVAGVAVTSNPDTMNRALGSDIGMPKGKPLATFQAKTGAYNAGLFAARVLNRDPAANSIGIIAKEGTGEDDTLGHANLALTALGLQAGSDWHNKLLAIEDTSFNLDEWLSERSIGVLIAGAFVMHVLEDGISKSNVPVLGVATTINADRMSAELDFIANLREGVPVGVFQDNAGGFNAGVEAAKILSRDDADLRQRLIEYSEDLRLTNNAKDKIMERLCDQAYDALSEEELQQLIDAELAEEKV
jgi:phosphoribosylcarboxyaminoimidazole (NCAIR) mutase